MGFVVENKSRQVIRLAKDEETYETYVKLFPGDCVYIEVCTSQVFRLCDPARDILSIKEVG